MSSKRKMKWRQAEEGDEREISTVAGILHPTGCCGCGLSHFLTYRRKRVGKHVITLEKVTMDEEGTKDLRKKMVKEGGMIDAGGNTLVAVFRKDETKPATITINGQKYEHVPKKK
jgi:hypothetical protein